MQDRPQPGQLLARGVGRHLESLGFSSLFEFVPSRGLRVDVMAVGPRGELWVVECKSCRADFRADAKWHGYLDWCDRFFWAVDADFPLDLLPEGTGLILADPWDAQILRLGPETPLAAARRKAMLLKIARTGADRLRRLSEAALSAAASA
ncbi:MmcB family DNA repair protein [Halovulum dunhuangense]|uniref:MmcB family DNA repair protein n=1 Tax=Halovulum dunhuangense TaxID=1505036 RepID=A0A849L4I3_9RHOB|nr:MmcB family DNA repair protein [Halovulum dunhuangense]NNU81338.1 MmcB family DNA repair protein [Halovulum dunhuangense]